jgi:hypothetical protein
MLKKLKEYFIKKYKLIEIEHNKNLKISEEL